jgi:hypothetical protein
MMTQVARYGHRAAPLVLSGPVSNITFDEFQRRQRAANYPNYDTDADLFGSWLSSLTGIHINPLKLSATKIDVGQLLKTAAITAGVVLAGPAIATLAAKATPAVISGLQKGGTAAVDALKALGAVHPTTPTPTLNIPQYAPVVVSPPVQPIAPLQANLMTTGAVPVTSSMSISPGVLVAGAALLFVLMSGRNGGH